MGKSLAKTVEEESDTDPTIPRWKRPLDLFLILVSAPLWLAAFIVCAIWIKLVSRGSILYCQERVGFREHPFTICKFRTMKQGADTVVHENHLRDLIGGGAPMTKLDDRDGRLILGGKLIRALGLDELPQLINVICGEMSIVGPRPCTPAELEEYPPPFKRRFNGLPGITGSWQVNGKNKTTFRRMIALDIHYLRTASVWSDLLFMLRTFPTIIGQLMDLLKRKRAKFAKKSAPQPLRYITPPPRFTSPPPQIGERPSLIKTAAHSLVRKTQPLIEAPSGHTEPVQLRRPPDG